MIGFTNNNAHFNTFPSPVIFYFNFLSQPIHCISNLQCFLFQFHISFTSSIIYFNLYQFPILSVYDNTFSVIYSFFLASTSTFISFLHIFLFSLHFDQTSYSKKWVIMQMRLPKSDFSRLPACAISPAEA